MYGLAPFGSIHYQALIGQSSATVDATVSVFAAISVGVTSTKLMAFAPMMSASVQYSITPQKFGQCAFNVYSPASVGVSAAKLGSGHVAISGQVTMTLQSGTGEAHTVTVALNTDVNIGVVAVKHSFGAPMLRCRPTIYIGLGKTGLSDVVVPALVSLSIEGIDASYTPRITRVFISSNSTVKKRLNTQQTRANRIGTRQQRRYHIGNYHGYHSV